jgi:hypothetical protein
MPSRQTGLDNIESRDRCRRATWGWEYVGTIPSSTIAKPITKLQMRALYSENIPTHRDSGKFVTPG